MLLTCGVLISLMGLMGCQSASTPDDPPATLDVKIAGQTFTLELALDQATRYQGLSGRTAIPDQGGMLFAFPESRPLSFVMRDCPVPIDVIFLTDTGLVRAVHAMKVEPPETRSDNGRLPPYRSRGPAQFAIELRGGRAAELGVQAGQQIDLPFDRLKQWAQ